MTRARKLLVRAVLPLLVAWPLIAWSAAELLMVKAEIPHADAIVVLSGAKDYVARASSAAQLFQEGRAPIVLLTDDGLRGPWSQTIRGNPSFAELAADELARHGVATDRITIVPEVVNGGTYSEAVHIRQYASAHRMKSILIVTSSYHTRRALWAARRVFRESGIVVGVASADDRALLPAVWWLSLSGWRTLGEEYAKLAYYLVHYS